MNRPENIEYKQSLVSRTIWAWQDEPKSKGSDRPALRVIISSFILGVGIALIFYYFDNTIMAWTVTGISIVLLLLAFLFPKIYFLINNVFRLLSYYIGLLFSWILLVPFFYLCAGGIHLVNKAFGKDPMHRSFNDRATTYWQDHCQENDIQQYRKQF